MTSENSTQITAWTGCCTSPHGRRRQHRAATSLSSSHGWRPPAYDRGCTLFSACIHRRQSSMRARQRSWLPLRRLSALCVSSRCLPAIPAEFFNYRHLTSKVTCCYNDWIYNGTSAAMIHTKVLPDANQILRFFCHRWCHHHFS